MSTKGKVLLAMSGGVDSSVAAILLQKQGYQVFGVTFLFADLEESNSRMAKDAEMLCESLNISHVTVDLIAYFKELILKPFITMYQQGYTPFPCAKCNPELKFKQLHRLSEEFTCEYIATGHYVIKSEFKGNHYVTKGVDNEKDQSFFLWGLNQKILKKALFPLGNLHKHEVRDIARAHDFKRLSAKKDSLGICFYEGTDYRSFLLKNGIISTPGLIRDIEGNVVGHHQGIINYTIGQRRGLGINGTKPWFVVRILPEKNEIIVGDYKLLYRTRIYIRDYYFTNQLEIETKAGLIVKIRYRLQETPCHIKLMDENNAEIILHEPLAMVAIGQTAVIYQGNRVLGGGFIAGST